MAWDLEIELVNRPGTIADLGEAAGSAGVNLLGVCGFPCDGVGVLHALVDEAASLVATLEASGYTVRGSREVLVTSVANQPGALGRLARRFADAGVNVDLLYVAENNQIVLGVDDLDAGRELL